MRIQVFKFGRVWAGCLILGVLVLAGCERGGAAPPAREVVVYTALDRGFSEPILDDFTKATGIKVLAQYDVESTKTVGLTNRIRAEKDRPRCDVFWNNEILNTLQLKSEGLLGKCDPPQARRFAAMWKDPEGYWYGFAARARVLIVNTELVPDLAFPVSIRDLADARWKGRTGLAKPLFGTTASHIACLYAVWGEDETGRYLEALKANDIQIHSGNKSTAEAVGGGTAAFAMTDTDDALEEIAAGRPVRIVYPDAAGPGPGTLFLPNTLAVVKGAPHPAEAAALIDFLLSAEVERALAAGPSAQIPLGEGVEPDSRVRDAAKARPMPVDFAAAARAFPGAQVLIEKRLLNPGQ